MAEVVELRKYTTDEMMTVAASHELEDGAVCFGGVGLPSDATDREPTIAEALGTTDLPTEKELEILRGLKARTEASRKKT